jgi:hypothetical protein
MQFLREEIVFDSSHYIGVCTVHEAEINRKLKIWSTEAMVWKTRGFTK